MDATGIDDKGFKTDGRDTTKGIVGTVILNSGGAGSLMVADARSASLSVALYTSNDVNVTRSATEGNGRLSPG